jgi:hypothetical protein
MAGLLAWLIPGLGHWYQGRRAKAVLYFVAIMGLFVFGLYLGGGSYVDPRGGKHELGYGRAAYFSWRAGDKRWNYFCQVGVGLAALPALVQAARMNHQQPVFWGGFMAPPLPSEAARGAAGNGPNAGQPTRAELDRWLSRRFELAGVFAMIAGLLNVLAIYDACAGPVVIQPAKKDEEEEQEEPCSTPS